MPKKTELGLDSERALRIAEAIKASRADVMRDQCICDPGTSRIDCPYCGENKGARLGPTRTVEGP